MHALCARERVASTRAGAGGFPLSSQKRAEVKSQASSRHLQRNNSGRPLCTVASHRRQKQQAGHAGPPCTLLSCFASRGRVQAGGPVPRPDVQLTRRVKLTRITRSATAPCSACHAVNSRSRWAMCRRWPVSQESSASAPFQLPIFIKVGVPCCSGGRAQARTQRLDIDVRRDIERNGLHHAALEQRQALSAPDLLAVLLPHARALASWP